MSKAEERALSKYPVHKGASKEWIESHLKGICSDYIEGYHQAEKDILSEYEWLISNVRILKLKYCHNREAVEAVEDVCGKLYKFKTDIEHG